MEKNNKLMIILIIIAGFIMLSFIASNTKVPIKGDEIYTEHKALYEQGSHIVLVSSDSCGYCQQYRPIIKEVVAEYGLSFVEVNTSIEKVEFVEYVLKKANVTSQSVPVLIVIKDGKAVHEVGLKQKDNLINYLKEVNIITTSTTAYNNIKDISINDYQSIIINGKRELVTITQTGCSACTAMIPNYNNVAAKNNLVINELNYSKLTEEARTVLNNSFDELKENFGTPLLLIIENNKIVAKLSGYTSEDKLTNFLKENSIIQ